LGALLGGFIGAGIPAWLAYLGMRRGRQATDATAFGPAMLVLDRMHPDRILFNVSGDSDGEATKVREVAEQTLTARERLLIVRAGHPRSRVREPELSRTKAVTGRIRSWVALLSNWARGRAASLSKRARHRARHAAAKVKIGRRTPGH
jgi:hypothetical protein